MLERYSREKMEKIWSEKNKFYSWLLVELYSVEAFSKINNEITERDIKNLWDKTSINIERIKEIEKVTRHDVIAFTRSLSEQLGKEKRWIHYGLTSTDVVDTGFGYRIKQANELISDDLQKLKKILRKLAIEHKNTPQMGRTHGIHAEPTSFGYKLALWYAEIVRNIERFNHARKDIEMGKISGAVGNFSNVPLEIQEYVSKKMGIGASLISTQTLQRDRHAFYISVVATIASTLDKIAVELRHLQRTEVNEIQEGFSVGQKGSSAMPHKKNPISAENISGLTRIIKGFAFTAFDNNTLWHERDLSHSSSERIMFPDATTLLDYAINRLLNIFDRIVVNKENMLKNINITNGVVFSQRVLLFLINEKGWSREKAYDTIQPLAMKSLEKGIHYKDLLIKKQIITEKESKNIFELSYYTRRVNEVFKKLGLI